MGQYVSPFAILNTLIHPPNPEQYQHSYIENEHGQGETKQRLKEAILLIDLRNYPTVDVYNK